MKNRLFLLLIILVHWCFVATAQQTTPTQNPCKSLPQQQQFDFWLGEWDVKKTGAEDGPTVGASKIESLENGCVILENWQSQGFSGKSWNFFDRGTNKWRQIWLDISGRKLEISGEYKDGAMRFEGEVVTAAGTKFKNRMTFFNLGDGKVRQFAERSTDGGTTWVTSVDLTYFRKK